MKTYKTDYPNEVHQLNVSVSKHLYVSKDGCVKYQKKPFSITLDKLSTASKRHLINYILRDHYSGTFYAELATTDDIISLGDFLHRSWSKKEGYMFCGVPKFLIISKVAADFFPKTKNLAKEFGITQTNATSGFHAGVRDIRTWEDEIKLMFCDRKFEELKSNTTRICADLCDNLNGKSKLKKWRENLKEGRVSLPPDIKTFLTYYT